MLGGQARNGESGGEEGDAILPGTPRAPLGMLPSEGKRNLPRFWKWRCWGFCCEAGLVEGWVHPRRVQGSPPGPGGGGSAGRGRGCSLRRVRARWPALILVVFSEELGRGHRGAQPKQLHEALHRPGTWGEKERG